MRKTIINYDGKMLKILLYLCMLLPSYEYVVICENLDTPLADTYGKAKRSFACPFTVTNKPNTKSLDRQKRVSHHGSLHHHNKFVVKSPNDVSTKKPMVLSRLTKNKHKSNKLDAKKRHIACEMFAKRLNLTENGTRMFRESSLSKLKSICGVLNGRKGEILKREEISPSPFTFYRFFGSTFTNLATSTVKYEAGIFPTVTTPVSKIYDNVITRAATAMTYTPRLYPLTQNFPSTTSTSAHLKSTEIATTRNTNPNNDENIKTSTSHSYPKGHTILTKIFVIPIEEESVGDGDKTSSLIQMTFDKASKTNKTEKSAKKDENRSVAKSKHKEEKKTTGGKNLEKRKKDLKKKNKAKEKKKKKKSKTVKKKSDHKRKTESSTPKNGLKKVKSREIKPSKQERKVSSKEKKKSMAKKKFSATNKKHGKSKQKSQKNKHDKGGKKKKP